MVLIWDLLKTFFKRKGMSIPLAENMFLTAGKGAENTNEKSRQCFRNSMRLLSHMPCLLIPFSYPHVISNLRKWNPSCNLATSQFDKACLTNCKSKMCRQLDMMKAWQARETKHPAKGEMKTKREGPRPSHKSKTQTGSPRGKVNYVSEPHCLGHQGAKRTNYVPEPPCLRHEGEKEQIMLQSAPSPPPDNFISNLTI